MASTVAGFEYDIFISYRHNDNLPDRQAGLDGWVTDFVQNLEKELRSTLKETVTIYFDRNPHDGLLETHHVDKSLEGKLKSIILIPIISQTYCDPKSFAWQHEFCAFNKLANEDQYGRDIKLSSGNVASRILPVKIHDLDDEDKTLLENELGGVLRAVDFIFKEVGVNRPLAPDDSDEKNLNKTKYKNQVNKVANAIKEIISSLKNPVIQKQTNNHHQQTTNTPPHRKYALAALLFLIAAVLGYFLIPTIISATQHEEDIDKSVAVLAFADMSPGKDQEWFSDGLTEEILNSLTNLNELKVTARTSSFYFKGKDVSLQEIAETLGVAHVVEGSVRKIDNQLRITAQLIRAKDGFHIWSQTYNRTTEDLFTVQTDIAENIARALLKEITPEKKAKLITSKPANIESYEYYLKGLQNHDKYYTGSGLTYFVESERCFLKAISLDPAYSETYGALADLYDTRSNIQNDKSKYWRLRDSVALIGYQLNPNSLQTLTVFVYAYAKLVRPNFDSAFYYSKKAYQLAPDAHNTNFAIAWFYSRTGLYGLAKNFYQKSIELDPLHSPSLNYLGSIQWSLGFLEEARKSYVKVLELDSENQVAHRELCYISLVTGNRKEAAYHLEILKKNYHDQPEEIFFQISLLALEGKKEEALKQGKLSLRDKSLLGMKDEFLAELDSLSDTPYHWLNSISLLKDPQYDFVRNEPEFNTILERVKKSYEERLSKYGTLD